MTEEKTHLLVGQFHNEVVTKQQMCEKWAHIYRVLHIFITIFIISAGLSISVITGFGANMYIIMVVGAAISGSKTISIIFLFEEKSIKMKLASIKLRRLSREILDEEAHYDDKKMRELQTEFDDLDLSLFEGTSIPDNVPTN